MSSSSKYPLTFGRRTSAALCSPTVFSTLFSTVSSKHVFTITPLSDSSEKWVVVSVYGSDTSRASLLYAHHSGLSHIKERSPGALENQSSNRLLLLPTSYEKFRIEWDTYEEKRTKACGTICVALEPSIGQRYWDSKSGDSKILWDTIKADFEKVIQLDGKHEQQKLAICKPEDFVSVRVGLPLKTRLYTTFAICGIAVSEKIKKRKRKRTNDRTASKETTEKTETKVKKTVGSSPRPLMSLASRLSIRTSSSQNPQVLI